MKLSEFIQKNIKTKVDYDGVYGAQCVDLFRSFCRDVLQIPHTGSCASSGGAKDLFLDYDKMPLEKKYFTKIKNFKTVKYGDIIIYGETDKNKYGHVAIAITNTNNKSILVFEQNGIVQDGAKLVERPMENILGILRFKEDVR